LASQRIIEPTFDIDICKLIKLCIGLFSKLTPFFRQIGSLGISACSG
jgi:hypothetical protein